MGIIEVACSPAAEIDPVFGLSQLQDELTGQGSAKADRRWLYDDRCDEPAEEPPEPEEEAAPAPTEHRPQPCKRGIAALIGKMFRR